MSIFIVTSFARCLCNVYIYITVLCPCDSGLRSDGLQSTTIATASRTVCCSERAQAEAYALNEGETIQRMPEIEGKR